MIIFNHAKEMVLDKMTTNTWVIAKKEEMQIIIKQQGEVNYEQL